jgi:hypothetical protein
VCSLVHPSRVPSVPAAFLRSLPLLLALLMGTNAISSVFHSPSGSPFGAGNRPYAVAVGDFNGDGIPDLATANSANNVTVLLVTASLGSQTITFAPLSNVTPGVSPFTLSATASSGLTVTFASNTTSVCTVNVATITILTAGSCSITASQAGNGTFAAATPVTQFFTVLNTQTITFAPLSNVTLGVAPFGISATASSGLTVTFASNTTSVCTVNVATVTILTAGSCSITASQAGNGTFAAATPVTQAFTVLKTQVIMFAQLSNVAVGVAPFGIRASASSGLTVTFASNTLSVCTLNAATVTILTTGTCSITASQAGNGTYAAATPVTQAFTVLERQTITFAPLSNLFFGVAPFGISATASSNLTVSFTSNTRPVCTVNVATVTILTAGTCSITASQAGNEIYAPATPVTRAFTVVATETITFGPLSNVTLGVSSFIVSATSSSGLTVSFASNTRPVCTVNVATVTILTAGTCSITASQAGNGTYAASPPVTQTFTVFNTQTITFGPLSNVTLGAAPFAISATASSGLTVTFASNTPSVCTVNLATVTILTAGSCSITASQAGNGTFAAATPATQAFTVLKTQTITFVPLSHVTLGVSPFTVSATASSGLTVTFASNTPSVCTVNVATVTILTAGSCSIIASQAGNGTYAAATPATQAFTVLGTQTTTFGPLSNVTLGVSPFTVSATASSGLRVSFASNTVSVCTVNVATVTILTAGNCSITASQAGNETYAAAAPVTQAFTVLTPQTITFAPLSNVTLGVVPFTVNATASSGLTITFTSNTLSVCTVNATTVTILTAGNCSITASQAGNGNYAAATPVTQASTVLQTQTITFAPLSSVILGVAPFGISAIASSNLPVTFTSNTLSVCTVNVAAVTILTAGSCSITASQAGNGAFAGATPVPQTFTVLQTQTITFAPLNNITYGVAPFGIGAAASSGLTVTFASTTLTVCTVNVATVTILATGNCSITAGQAGNGTYAPAPPVTQTFTVSNIASQTITFDGIPNQILGISPFVVAAQASSLLPVTFTSTTNAVCKTASNLVTLVTPGTCSITAAQGGNGNYTAATPATRSFTVSRANPAGTLTPSGNSPFPLTVNIRVGAALGDFNGDGIQDLVLADNLGVSITILFGNGSGGFAAAPGGPINVGAGPCSVAVGDFNGDGFQDLAVVNQNSNNVTILLGNGSGGFTPAIGSPFPVGTTPTFIAVGDFNRDGIQDLAVTNESDNTVTILLGNGLGGFTAAEGSPFAVGFLPVQVVVGDFNGDGNQDIATTGGRSANVTVLLGNGSGGFSPAPGSPFGANLSAIAIGDFNGDGILDLAATGSISINGFNSSGVTVLLGNGSGGFTPTPGSPFPVGGVPIFIVAADFNGDGITDLATANANSNSLTGSVTVLLGNGSGGFQTAAGAPFQLNTTPFAMVGGDFNGDGVEDLVTANNSDNVTVLLGTQTPTSSVLSTTSSMTILVGQSVPLTLAVSDAGSAFNTLTGTATFLDGSTTLGTASQNGSPYTFTASGLAVGSHALTASYSGGSGSTGSTSNTITINVLATQTITFAPLSNVTIGVLPFAISATASSNLTVSFASNTLSVCKINAATVTILTAGSCSITASQAGNGTHAAATPVTQAFTVLQTQAITFAPLNNVTSGVAPFGISSTASSNLMVSLTSNTLSVCKINAATVTILTAGSCSITASQAGNGTFAAATPVTRIFTVDPSLQTITFDAIPTQIFGVSPFVIAAEANSGLPVGFMSTTPAVCRMADDLVMLLGEGTCSITASQPGNAGYSAATLVTQSFAVSVAKLSGTLTAAPGSPFAVGPGPESVAVGDFNGDGIPDLAVANGASNNVTVVLGNGSGGYTTALGSPFTVGPTPVSVAVGDFNGDGIQDLAVANDVSNNVTVLLGSGSGGFTEAAGSPFAVGTNPYSVVVGDFNGDGIQDLATGNGGSNNVTVLLGDGSGGFSAAMGSPFTVGTNPRGLAVGDFNGDGIQDLATTSANAVTVLLGNGLGGFAAAPGSPFAAGTGPFSVVVGDFNGDGIQDLAVANDGSNNVTVLLGNGSGGFTAAPGSPFAVGSGPESVAVGDFNGDGIPDLITANYSGSNVTILLGNGSDGFTVASGSPFPVGTNPQSVVVGDFNGDGIEDIATANYGSNNVTVLLGAVPVAPPPLVAPPLTISSSTSSIATTLGASVSASFSASGGTQPYTFSASGLPTGVSLSSSGSLSGSASQAGTFTASVTVTDSNYVTASTSVTINVLGLTTTSLPGGTVGQSYFASLAATGGSGYSFSATGLPPGLSLSGSGTVGGTPKTAGAYMLAVTVTSGEVSAMANVSLTIVPAQALAISSASLPGGTVNVLYSQSLTATGGFPPYRWSVISGAPPQSLSLSASGIVSGTPTTPGSFSFGVLVTDTSGAIATATASLTIQAAPLKITTQSVPAGMIGVAYPIQQLAASGGVPPYTWALSNGSSLPPGLTFSSDGVLTGVPGATGTSSENTAATDRANVATTGTFTFGITVMDQANTQAGTTFTLTIRPASDELILTTSSLTFSLMTPATSPPASQVVGLQSTVASQPIAYTLSVSPPAPWLALTNGTTTPDSIQVAISPAALTLSPGTYQTTITATCSSGFCAGTAQSVLVDLTVTAAPPQLLISTGLLSFATTNAALGSLSQPINVRNVGGGSLGFGSVVCEAVWCTAGPLPSSSLAGGVSAAIPVIVNPSLLSPGFYRTQVDISTSGGKGSVPVTLFISANATLTLAPAGTLFNQPAGSAPGNRNGSFLVSVNSSAPVNFSAAIVPVPGLPLPSWLVLGTTGGSASATQPGTVSFSIDPVAAAALAPGAYYGEIEISSPDLSNSPEDFEVVLNVSAAGAPQAPDPEPGGLLFITTVGGVLPPQTVTVYSGSVLPLTFQASAATTDGGGWLSVAPVTGSTSATGPGVTTVSVNASKLSAGVYHGGVSYSLSATAVRTVSVTLIVSAGGASSTSSISSSSISSGDALPRASGCTPSKLVPAQTGLVDSFFAPAGWPTPLAVLLFDDCGNVVNNGQIVATFSNGDPPLALALANPSLGLYSGTWSPANPSSQVAISVTASSPNFPAATSPLMGAVAPNAVPLLSPNGTLHVFTSLVGGALAPGTIVQIFGQNLAGTTATATAFPLLDTLPATNGSSVIIGGTQAPLYYVSPVQINAQIPFELQPGQEYQVIISANGALTTPQSIQLSATAPGLDSFPDGTLKAQHASDGSLVTTMNPAMAGEYLMAYLAGLGDTTVPVMSGAPSPSSPNLATLPAQDTLVLTINGSQYPIYFAGLTPGLAGLYQMNFQVPAGLPAGNITIQVSQNGQSSNQTVLPYQP